jgi:hypothetical protein
MEFKYFPVLRSRQQEIDVLEKFDFGDDIIPLVEIIKEKARTNQKKEGYEDYLDLFSSIKSKKVLIDLPVYLDPTINTANEVRKFFFSTITLLEERITYFKLFSSLSKKVVPVISILQPYSDEADTLIHQFENLKIYFPQIAIRIYIKQFDDTINEISKIELRENDLIIYDIDTTDITNPLVKLHKTKLDFYNSAIFKIVIRSAINTEIQNVRLAHGEVIPQANNSLIELFALSCKFNGFGDFAGVKKDDISTGGTISPGFIFYSPLENMFYGFKGKTKSLSEFEDTIVPDVLSSEIILKLQRVGIDYLDNNLGYKKLLDIGTKIENGKSQAKFKWISIMHYLHSIKTKINRGEFN